MSTTGEGKLVGAAAALHQPLFQGISMRMDHRPSCALLRPNKIRLAEHLRVHSMLLVGPFMSLGTLQRTVVR